MFKICIFMFHISLLKQIYFYKNVIFHLKNKNLPFKLEKYVRVIIIQLYHYTHSFICFFNFIYSKMY